MKYKRPESEEEKKVKKLAQEFGVKPYMAALFLSELKQSELPGDEKAKARAKELGLI